jgi:iron complex transport system ATP-binding protein
MNREIQGLPIKIENLVVGYGAEPVLDGVNLEISAGEFVGIVGPNGSGKTTLLRAIARVLKPSIGRVTVGGLDVHEISSKRLAQEMAVVPQDTIPAFDFTVREVVLMGRTPHLSRLQMESHRDYAVAENAMRLTGTLDLANRQFAALSGGERQRVVIARALAQEPKVILLDEPTTHLDMNYQFEVMNLIYRLNRDRGITVVAVLHDLNLAAHYCGTLVMLRKGKILAYGEPKDVITADNVRRVYGAEVWVRKHPTTGRPYVIAGVGRSLSESEADKFERRPKVHVICGGGTGAPIFAKLIRRGFQVTAGVLNAGDTDQEAAEALGVYSVCTPQFTAITEEAAEENLRLAMDADVVVVSDAPFGVLNLPNLITAAKAVESGAKVILLRPSDFRMRDFTGGEASEIFESIASKAASASSTDEIVAFVEQCAVAEN